MKVQKLIIACLILSLSIIPLTGCGSDDAGAADSGAETSAIADVVEEPVADVVEEPIEGEEETTEAEDTSARHQLVVEEDTTDRTPIPVDYFKTIGKPIKQVEGWSIVMPEGDYLRDAVVSYNGNVFYFNSDGILTDKSFVKFQKDDGTIIERYISNGNYQNGFIEKDGKQYYVDENEGLITSTEKVIDGEIYYFDATGRIVSEDRYASEQRQLAAEEQEAKEREERIARIKQAKVDYYSEDGTVIAEDDEDLEESEQSTEEETQAEEKTQNTSGAFSDSSQVFNN